MSINTMVKKEVRKSKFVKAINIEFIIFGIKTVLMTFVFTSFVSNRTGNYIAYNTLEANKKKRKNYQIKTSK